MHESQKDTYRAQAAAKAIIDSRDPDHDGSAILVTTEHAISAILIAVCGGNVHMAAEMLTEGLVPGIEERLSGSVSV